MELITAVARDILLCLSMGLYFFHPLANVKVLGAGFIRLIVSISGISFLILAGWSMGLKLFNQQAQIASIFIVLGFIIQYFFYKDEKTFAMKVISRIVFLSFFILLNTLYSSWSSFLFILSSIFFFGINFYAMILGHYYLVVPKLSESFLIKSIKVLWFLLLIKIIFSLWQMTLLGSVESLDLFDWIIISMRWLWGYLAIGILSFFAYRLSAMKSIQSATGILYVMDFFVIIGEMTSLYLFQSKGLLI